MRRFAESSARQRTSPIFLASVNVTAIDDGFFDYLAFTQGLDGAAIREHYDFGGPERILDLTLRRLTSLERDKIFFVVKQMNLTGQQGGVVNLRLQVSTWMRNAVAAASGLPQANTHGVVRKAAL